MVSVIPKGVYTMKGKMSIISQNSYVYCKSSKKQKSIMLDELSEMLHMSRKYVGYLLRNSGKTIYVKLWRISGYVSSKHLVAFIRVNQDKLYS